MFGCAARQHSRCCLRLLALAVIALLIGCTSPSRKLTRAQASQDSGDYAAAIRQYAAVLARIPDSQPRLISQINVRIAESQWAQGTIKAALISLQNALAADPQNLTAHVRFGGLLLAGGSAEGAIEEAHWVLVRDPNSLEALTLLGGAFAAAGDL